jgi:hypothetical protein
VTKKKREDVGSDKKKNISKKASERCTNWNYGDAVSLAAEIDIKNADIPATLIDRH